MRLRTISAALAGLALLAGHSEAGLVNPGFEDGPSTFVGWTVSGASITTASTNVHSGLKAAVLQANPTTISQDITGLTAGSSYTVSFWLRNSQLINGTFTTFWAGSSVLSLSATTTSLTYTNYSATVVAIAEDLTHHNTLKFQGVRSTGYFVLDDVSVTLLSPEPSTMASAGLGLIGLAAAVRRGRRPIA